MHVAESSASVANLLLQALLQVDHLVREGPAAGGLVDWVRLQTFIRKEFQVWNRENERILVQLRVDCEFLTRVAVVIGDCRVAQALLLKIEPEANQDGVLSLGVVSLQFRDDYELGLASIVIEVLLVSRRDVYGSRVGVHLDPS